MQLLALYQQAAVSGQKPRFSPFCTLVLMTTVASEEERGEGKSEKEGESALSNAAAAATGLTVTTMEFKEGICPLGCCLRPYHPEHA